MDLQALYSNAVSEYEAGAYEKACDGFSHLSTIAPAQSDVWKGLAACHQVQKNYTEALMAWSVAALLDTSDPAIHFHAAECLVAQGNPSEARKAVRIALGLPCSEPFLDQVIRLKEVIENG